MTAVNDKGRMRRRAAMGFDSGCWWRRRRSPFVHASSCAAARPTVRAASRSSGRYGIRIEASRLDYNLAALSVGLSNVRIAADRTPALPFFEADYVRQRSSRAHWAA